MASERMTAARVKVQIQLRSIRYIGLVYAELLSDLPQEDRLAEISQLMIDMMDWTSQTEEEGLYVKAQEMFEYLRR